jgi:hypothetical protein
MSYPSSPVKGVDRSPASACRWSWWWRRTELPPAWTPAAAVASPAPPPRRAPAASKMKPETLIKLPPREIDLFNGVRTRPGARRSCGRRPDTCACPAVASSPVGELGGSTRSGGAATSPAPPASAGGGGQIEELGCWPWGRRRRCHRLLWSELAVQNLAGDGRVVGQRQRKRKNLTGGSLLKFTKTPLVVRSV